MRAGLAPLSAAQLDALRADPDAVGKVVYSNDEQDREHAIDLDKAWHGIHWLLTGEGWGGEPPLSLAILGGTDIGPDQGYGPARFVTPQQVGAVAVALAALTDEDLARRYDAKTMDERHIYPTVWERDGAEALGYLIHHVHVLARFYAKAAQRGDAVLQWIS